MKKALSQVEVGIHRTAEGEIWQTNSVNANAKKLFDSLRIKLPPRILALKPAKEK